jgi:hypothetical protein
LIAYFPPPIPLLQNVKLQVQNAGMSIPHKIKREKFTKYRNIVCLSCLSSLQRHRGLH